jgi:hypothetical protein
MNGFFNRVSNLKRCAMRKVCLSVSILVVLSMTAFAVTRLVPQQYPTIAAAILASVDGDSIIVGPGVYDHPPTIYNEPDNITLLGNGYLGPDRTVILGNLATEIEGKIDLRFVENWEIGGFELTVGRKGINVRVNGMYIHDIYVHDLTWNYANGVNVDGNNVTIERCIFQGCPTAGIEVQYPTQTGHEFVNNTIVNCTNGILVRGSTPNLIVENNIITNCGDGVEFVGTWVPSIILDYNDVWSNGNNWSYCTPGTHNISANPLFVGGTGAGQFMLIFGSPCIDAGDPASPLDPDGTIADIGCFWYDQGPGGGLVALNLEPVNPPIIIPVQGGSFGYTANLSCDTSGWAMVDAWADLRLPNGLTMGPLFIRPNIRLEEGQSLLRTLQTYVSAWAMPGTYWFRGYLGDYPNTVEASDSFSFVKAESFDSPPPGEAAYLTISGWGEEVRVELPPTSAMPQELSLSATPNPFNPSTAISYELRTASFVNLKVYDTTGRLVATLVNGWRQTGKHEAIFDGSKLASGMYLVKIQTGNQGAVRKVMLIK